MIIEKSLKKCGLQLEADSLPKKDRKVKTFQRLIAAMRATEAEVIDKLSEAEHDLNAALRDNGVLREEVFALKTELRKFRVQEHLSQIESLSSTDRQRLLEAS